MLLEIILYPHLSIPILFFENMNRHASFFEVCCKHFHNTLKPTIYPLPLNFLLDHGILYFNIKNSGLHHVNPTIRSRVCYLFLRFVKSLRSKLGQLPINVVNGIQVVFYFYC